MVCVRAL
jgi:hypothetical protein